MFNLIGIALAHAGDESADYSNMMGGNMMNMMGNMWGMGSGWGWTAMIFMWLFWILILIALVLLIMWLIKQIQK